MPITTLVPISEDRQPQRGWKILIDGAEVERSISSLELRSERFGSIFYGDDPSHGYDGVCISEPGGGGQQVIPYAIIDDKVRVGVVPEWRRNHGRVVLNVPRGYKDPKLSHLQSALVESVEEIGVSTTGRIFRLPGVSVNFNSAWNVTLEPTDGFVYFAFEVAPEELTKDDEGNIVFVEAHEAVQGAGEKIFKCRFIPWNKALQLEDNFTVAGVGRLILHLIATGRGGHLAI